jgi:hypothetical protein
MITLLAALTGWKAIGAIVGYLVGVVLLTALVLWLEGDYDDWY